MKKYNYRIYQLDIHNENVMRDHKMFESWDMLNKTAGFNFHQYKQVWEDEIEVEDEMSEHEVLDVLFRKFNLDFPKNYYGRSLSVSDVVVLNDVKWYCDSIGWTKI